VTSRPAIEAPSPSVSDAIEVESARRTIAETLSPTPVTVDEIIRTCQLSPAVVTTVLLEWELADRLERHPGNKVSLIAASKTS
jgi:DNA processing protein